jgi:hypothetical protein
MVLVEESKCHLVAIRRVDLVEGVKALRNYRQLKNIAIKYE